MKDLVNNALSVLAWVVEEISRGNEIAAVNEGRGTYRVLVSPLLQHVKAQAEQKGLQPAPAEEMEPAETERMEEVAV